MKKIKQLLPLVLLVVLVLSMTACGNNPGTDVSTDPTAPSYDQIASDIENAPPTEPGLAIGGADPMLVGEYVGNDMNDMSVTMIISADSTVIVNGQSGTIEQDGNHLIFRFESGMQFGTANEDGSITFPTDDNPITFHMVYN